MIDNAYLNIINTPQPQQRWLNYVEDFSNLLLRHILLYFSGVLHGWCLLLKEKSTMKHELKYFCIEIFVISDYGANLLIGNVFLLLLLEGRACVLL